jgi:hypothetical protein
LLTALPIAGQHVPEELPKALPAGCGRSPDRLYGAKSQPCEKPKSGKIAVKVINTTAKKQLAVYAVT